MKITILGTGCAWTKRACASYLINNNIMVDPGFGSIKQLFKSNDNLLHHEKIEKLELVLITHFHFDHYFDMPLIMQKVATGKYPDRKLTVACPKGGKNNIRQLCLLGMSKHTFDKVDLDKYINFVEVKDGTTFSFENFEITAIELDHGDCENFGFMIKDENGKIISFTGDTTMCPNLLPMIEKSDFIFIDMAGTHKSKHHYNIVEGIDLMNKYKGQKVIVPCHLTSQSLDYTKGKICAPKDLMIIDTSLSNPYDFEVKKKKTESTETTVELKKDLFTYLRGQNVDLILKKEIESHAKNPYPAYVYEIVLHNTYKKIGELKYIVNLNKKIDDMETLICKFSNDTPLQFKIEACELITPIADALGLKYLYLTTDPNDLEARKICEMLGAKLKEIKTLKPATDGSKNNIEQCIWEWKF